MQEPCSKSIGFRGYPSKLGRQDVPFLISWLWILAESRGRPLKKPQRLWILTSEYEPHIIGGLGTAATNLTKAYVRSGVHTTVLTQGKYSRLRITNKKGLRIVRFPRRSAFYSKKAMQYKPAVIERWLHKQGYRKPDGIHIHSLPFKNLAKYYRMKHRIPVIYTCHSLVSKTVKRKALKHQVQLFKTANKIVVPSRSELAKLKKRYRFCSNKAIAINHGIVLQKSADRRPRHHLLFVGRLVPLKGVKPLLKAMALLKRGRKKFRLTLVGTGPKWYVRHLKAYASKLGVSSEVHWLGYRQQRQVQKMYASYGAVVMPSLRESFGLVALEALASGIPLVSTRAGGLAEFVNSRVAQTIPTAAGPAIAKAIQNMWNRRTITNRRISAGRKLASRYRWPHAARRYKKLFHQI
jgi:glycogen(starch) synthase